MYTFTYDSFSCAYELIKQKRKTLSLTVQPNLNIILKSPVYAKEERIQLFLRKKWFWIEKQLSFFRKHQHQIHSREYISGESFLYLGRQYKIIVKQSDLDEVTLEKGRLLVKIKKESADRKYLKKVIDRWINERVTAIFYERYNRALSTFTLKKQPSLKVRDMRKRWGSYSVTKNIVTLNPKLIHTSKVCIDYVITHELCHTRHKNHDKKFFNYLEEKFPEWEKVKSKLESYIIY